MAVPKKKVSRSRRNMRRFAGGNRLELVTTNSCSNCSEPKRPHRVCACGFYEGKAVFKPKTKEVSARQN